jgi:hypothetical protein
MKIHCIESQKENFDEIPINEIRKMVGWIEPPDKYREDIWTVTMADGCHFECSNQEIAQIMATNEEIKAMLLK